MIAYRVGWIVPRRDFFGPVPFLVPWFGAVGATLLSLSAVFEKHSGDRDVEFRFWQAVDAVDEMLRGTKATRTTGRQ